LIYNSENKISDLKYHIIKDFKELIPDIEKDIEATSEFNPVFNTWIEEGRLLGYMGVVRTDEYIFCSYTKVFNRKIYKMMYAFFKDLYKEAECSDRALLTDGTNFAHCKNHVTPYKDTALFQWKL